MTRAAPDGAAGRLALVLHTHMPYVEGFGTWPFGEEWLWEAIATSYLPLLDVLEGGAAITLSLTPVLCDQLEAAGVGDRFLAFLRDVRRESHRLDAEGCRAGGREDLAAEIERGARDYERAAEAWTARGGDLLGALAPFASWTSSATHAVLPLLATDAGARLQIDAGIRSHRARLGEGWRGGFWLPECAHAPWLDRLLAEGGVRATCVDLTDVRGLGAAEQLRPFRSGAGPVLVPIDRVLIDLVWSPEGYPSAAEYRDTHRRTTHHHKAWSNGGGAYDPRAAAARAKRDAADFVARARRRLAHAALDLGAPGLAVCALDTELLGHWWYEGIAWLEAVVYEAKRQGLALTHLDDALDEIAPAPAPEDPLPTTTWGSPRDLSTWDGPGTADLAWRARGAELRVVAMEDPPPAAAIRELLALQSSDWAFMVTRELAGPYAGERAEGHARALDEALQPVGSGAARARNLAINATPAPLLVP